MNVECGSCDYKIDQLDKLQSHYISKHSLCFSDSWLLARSRHEEAERLEALHPVHKRTHTLSRTSLKVKPNQSTKGKGDK